MLTIVLAILPLLNYMVNSTDDCFASATIDAGSVQWLWYLWLPQVASGPVRPCAYAEINLADWFAYLCDKV